MALGQLYSSRGVGIIEQARAVQNTVQGSGLTAPIRESVHSILDEAEMQLYELVSRVESLADFVSGPTPKDGTKEDKQANDIMARVLRIRHHVFMIRDHVIRLEQNL